VDLIAFFPLGSPTTWSGYNFVIDFSYFSGKILSALFPGSYIEINIFLRSSRRGKAVPAFCDESGRLLYKQHSIFFKFDRNFLFF
jgi:hypothetical protein